MCLPVIWSNYSVTENEQKSIDAPIYKIIACIN